MKSSRDEEGKVSPFRYWSLRIWQDAMALTLAVRASLRAFPAPHCAIRALLFLAVRASLCAFPAEERFAWALQGARCTNPFPSNIAEGGARHTVADFAHFLYIVRGSLAELAAQLTIDNRLGYLSCTHQTQGDIANLGRSISAVIRHLRDTAGAVVR